MPSEPTESNTTGDFTILLRRLAAGEEQARAELVSAMYPELKRIAGRRMRRERADHTLQPTALVNEFFLEIARDRKVMWRDRKHFLAVASQAMRRFLIDYSRSHDAARRGGGWIKISLPCTLPASRRPPSAIEAGPRRCSTRERWPRPR